MGVNGNALCVISRHDGVSSSALACGACKSCYRSGFENRVKREAEFKKIQNTLSTTERHFTLSVVCLLDECIRRHRKGNLTNILIVDGLQG